MTPGFRFYYIKKLLALNKSNIRRGLFLYLRQHSRVLENEGQFMTFVRYHKCAMGKSASFNEVLLGLKVQVFIILWDISLKWNFKLHLDIHFQVSAMIPDSPQSASTVPVWWRSRAKHEEKEKTTPASSSQHMALENWHRNMALRKKQQKGLCGK